MSRLKTIFFCTECGNETARWQGQCPACGAWNTLAGEPSAPRRARGRAPAAPGSGSGAASAAAAPIRIADVSMAEVARWTTGLGELDLVLGGGIVPGSVVLIGGEPGIGKSTILLQVAARLAGDGRRTLYVSGEEAAAQVRLRADRLSERAGDVLFLGETDIDAVLRHVATLAPDVLFIDSIQTVYAPDLEGAPGNVTQVRECAARLQRLAKQSGAAVFVVGHVTKGGVVAGPKTLEHIVDTVLYFEGDGSLAHRILRATKNRFGAAEEIGVFRMAQAGLEPVANPSELFLAEHAAAASGSAVAATIEGTRPLLVEVQALCTASSYGGGPQRVATGFDRQRLALLLAVLERRAGIPFGNLDVFLNAVGGVRLSETASDLAVAAALATAALDRPAPPRCVFAGELGLGGEVRPVSQIERRIAEAARLGFERVFLSPRSVPERLPRGVRAVPVEHIGRLLQLLEES
jgi:DNA repair protein RadA/Sms